MKGDFTRDTFDASNHFSRVLMQQGRVQLDADWNEQAAILLHYLQTLAADLIGPHGGPGDGFKIGAATAQTDPPIAYNFAIGKGHYYVNGILCENHEDKLTYKSQKDFPVSKDETLTAGLVYLDVWERHLTYVEQEDDDGSVVSMREVALNNADTATRAQVVWQVKVLEGEACPKDAASWINTVQSKLQLANRGMLRASAKAPQSTGNDKPCVTPPESRYRGAENQLYRVEIHDPGPAGKANEGATFKWSRENGSVIFPVLEIAGDRVKLENLGRDARLGLQEGDWVEIVDDIYALHNLAEPLLQVVTIDRDSSWVTLSGKPEPEKDVKRHCLLRRWEGITGIKEKATNDQNDPWIDLEGAIQIQFQKDAEVDSKPVHEYRTGDYWLIPARTATGDVEWPGPKDDPKACEPHGITHHYAPLAIITVTDEGVQVANNGDCRNCFDAWTEPCRNQA